jgi:hypothetical protein
VTAFAALCAAATCLAVVLLRAAKARNAAERAHDAEAFAAAASLIPAQRGADT